MSMSKPNKPAEKETSPSASTTTASAATATKTDVKGLQTALKEKGIDFSQFKTGEENWRKRALKEEYQEFKTKFAWKYDEPIVEEESA